MNSSGTTVSAELGFELVGPEQTIVPLIASLYYNRNDPYAIRMAFHIGAGEPVEWIFARDLIAAGLDSPEGTGDVRAWPSSGMAREPAADGLADEDAAAGHEILNIEVSSPSGCAHFEIAAAAMSEFLQRTYQIVPAGEESGFLDIEAELNDILRQA
jgi:hypothetical protein